MDKQKRREQAMIADILSVQAIMHDSKQRPGCKMAISRIDGGNKMVRYKCGTRFCCRCNLQIDGYDDHYKGGCKLFMSMTYNSEDRMNEHRLVDFDSEFPCTNTCGDLCFVMEYMEAGSFLEVLTYCHRLPERLISGVARRVLEGLNYLHGIQIVHRDIKPSNLLINLRGEIKIADFGVSRLVAGKPEECESYVGTWAYMSPERWNAEYCNGYAGDVWSLGVVLLECLVGRFPLIDPGQKLDWATLMCAIFFGEKMDMPEKASLEFKSFVMRCLEKDWTSRATVEELLNHPFVAQCRARSIQELIGCGYYG